jgi:hypothetical protein
MTGTREKNYERKIKMKGTGKLMQNGKKGKKG